MQPPYDQFHYGLASPTDACAWGLRSTLAPPPLMSEFVGMASYAPTYFLDLMDDDDESDGSSIGDMAPSHRPSRECAMTDAPEQPLGATKSSRTHAPPGPHTEAPELTSEHGEDLRR